MLIIQSIVIARKAPPHARAPGWLHSCIFCTVVIATLLTTPSINGSVPPTASLMVKPPLSPLPCTSRGMNRV